MTLRKLTLSISLLAASLMLAAPAQAETWSCAYKTNTIRVLVATRMQGTMTYEGKTTPRDYFHVSSSDSGKVQFDIVRENKNHLVLLSGEQPKEKSITVLTFYKESARFARAGFFGLPNEENAKIFRAEGKCKVH